MRGPGYEVEQCPVPIALKEGIEPLRESPRGLRILVDAGECCPVGRQASAVGRNACWGRKPRSSAESLPIAGAELGHVVELPTLRSDTSRPFEKPSMGASL